MRGTCLDSQAPRASGSIPLCAERALCAHMITFHLSERHEADWNMGSWKAVLACHRRKVRHGFSNPHDSL